LDEGCGGIKIVRDYILKFQENQAKSGSATEFYQRNWIYGHISAPSPQGHKAASRSSIGPVHFELQNWCAWRMGNSGCQ
jgi:hypothetical protein